LVIERALFRQPSSSEFAIIFPPGNYATQSYFADAQTRRTQFYWSQNAEPETPGDETGIRKLGKELTHYGGSIGGEMTEIVFFNRLDTAVTLLPAEIKIH
jgi:hypothetical protein